MNTNIILDGFNAMLKQLIAAAVAEAIKPLKERITVLEGGEWTGMEHVAAKAVQPLLNRITALEINQTLKRNEVVDLVDKAVENAIEAYDFSEVIDWANKIEDGIENYDFSDIIQDMINESLDNQRVATNQTLVSNDI